MAELPEARSVAVVRTDFTDDAAWEETKVRTSEPTEDGFGADVDFVENHALTGLDEAAIAAIYPRRYPHDYQHPVVFVVDEIAMSMPERPVLVVNLNAGVDAPPFRALPQRVQSIQNNLSLANINYVEFATSTDTDGVFRGF
ncbi:MAG: hypothetical protein SYR96_27655 [Actinomycetota bacterium]|nr:hypothetical protein [Actinomycetota bacterium]